MYLRFILYLLLMPSIAFTQWRYYEENDPFDGKYKVAYVSGSGNDYPYNDPTLYLRKYSDDKHFEMYIDDVGYIPDRATIRLKFSNGKEFTNYGGSSRNRKAVFFSNEPYDIVDALTKSSKVTIRVKTDLGQNTMNFGLTGSSKAINFVVPNLSNIIEDLNRKEQIELENKRKLQLELDALENQFNKNYDLLKKSIEEKLISLGNTPEVYERVILNLDFKNDEDDNAAFYSRHINKSNENEENFNNLMKSKDLFFDDITITNKTYFGDERSNSITYFSCSNRGKSLISIDIMAYDTSGIKVSKFSCTNFNNLYLNELTDFSKNTFIFPNYLNLNLDNSFECNDDKYYTISLKNKLEEFILEDTKDNGFQNMIERDDIRYWKKVLYSSYADKDEHPTFQSYFLKKLSKKLKKLKKENIVISEFNSKNFDTILKYNDAESSYIILPFNQHLKSKYSRGDLEILIYKYSNSISEKRVAEILNQLLISN